MSKLCLKYNVPSLYRSAIYQMIDKEYDCDWYFGPTTAGIKKMDTSTLRNVKFYKVLGNVDKIFWNLGELRLLFKKDYQTYFSVIENRCVTDWIFYWLAFHFFPKKKFYIWTHGWYGRETGFDAIMKLWLYRHVTGTFVYGNRAKELLIKKGIPSGKLFVIHNSLDYEKQIELRKQNLSTGIYLEHFKNDFPVIVMIGRLNLRKRLDVLIRAVKKLENKSESYNVILIGDGPDRVNIESMVDSLNLNNRVWFYGACYNEKENAELLYNSDMCVVPGDIGLTAIHSLMFGVPVITHNRFTTQGPEFEAIKSGQTGDFFERDNVQSLADTISRWFKSKEGKRDEVRQVCYREIDNNWNPSYQMKVIKDNLKF